jgi:hypothetical protein
MRRQPTATPTAIPATAPDETPDFVGRVYVDVAVTVIVLETNVLVIVFPYSV